MHPPFSKTCVNNFIYYPKDLSYKKSLLINLKLELAVESQTISGPIRRFL